MMTMKSLTKPFAAVALLLLVGGAGPCDQRVELNQSSACGGKCTSAQICVHYPSCEGGGTYPDACEDRKIGFAELCDNYTGAGGSYSVDADQTLLTCVCPPGRTADGGANGGAGGTDMSKALCGNLTCASNTVCVHYPSCSGGNTETTSCEPTTQSFATDCSNYLGKYTVDPNQTTVTCVCP